MPVVVNIPHVGEYEFPDTMSDAEIDSSAGRLYDENRAKRASLTEQIESARSARTRSGIIESVAGGVESLTQGIADPLGTLLKGSHAAITTITRQPYADVNLQAPIIDLGAIKDSWVSQTILGSPGVPEMVSGFSTLENLAYTGPMVVAPASRTALLGAFSAMGAKHAPEAAAELGRASAVGSGEEMAAATYGAAATGAMALAPVAGAMALSRKGAPATAAVVDNASRQLSAETSQPKRTRVDVENLDAMDAAAERQATAVSESPKPTEPTPKEVMTDATEMQGQRQGRPEGPVEVRSAFPEVEAAMQAARGIKKKPVLERIKGFVADQLKGISRHFPELDPKTDGAVINTLRLAEEIPVYSKFSAARNISGMVRGLEPLSREPIKDTAIRFVLSETTPNPAWNLYERLAILPDLIKDVERGLYEGKKIPFYPDKESMLVDLQRYEAQARDYPEVAAALADRQSTWNALRQEAVDLKILPPEVLNDPRYYHHQVLKYMNDQDMVTTKTGMSGLGSKKQGFQEARVGSSEAYNTRYLESEFEVMSQLISQIETRKAKAKVKMLSDIGPELRAKAKDEGVAIDSLIPEDYTKYKPTKGTRFYDAKTLPESVLERLLESDEISISEADLKTVKAAAQSEEWIIPRRLAKTLDSMRSGGETAAIDRAVTSVNTKWKQWTLLNPTRFVKYELNNTSGDLDIAFAYNPKILGYMKDAHKISREAAYGRGRLSEDLDYLQKQGVVNSNFVTHEVPDIASSKLFEALDGTDPSLIGLYWRTVKDFNSYRENMLRVAAFRFFRDEWSAGRKRYGASNPDIVDAIPDINEKSALLARELIGDYGAISHSGQWIRSRLIPFYSWIEINTKRYPALFRNLRKESLSELTKDADAGRLKGVIAAKAAGKMAKHSAQIAALYALKELWNQTVFPDEEREIGLQDRRQHHIILGRNEDGDIMTLRFQGALSDFLSWGGLEDFPQDIRDIKEGRKSLADQGSEMVNAPWQKIVNSMLPIQKAAGEALAGQSLYPDPSNPRMIRDPLEHIAGTFSLRTIYKYMAGYPTRGAGQDLANFVFYTSNPGESAYYAARTMAYNWLDKNKIDNPGGRPTKASNALYYWRQAKKYNQPEMADRWMRRWEELNENVPVAKKRQALRQSILAQRPIADIPTKRRGEFYDSLSQEERVIFEKAEQWWADTYASE